MRAQAYPIYPKTRRNEGELVTIRNINLTTLRVPSALGADCGEVIELKLSTV
jgi:hypothetical protein